MTCPHRQLSPRVQVAELPAVLRPGQLALRERGSRGVQLRRPKFNISPDLQVTSFVQYDTASQAIGTNSRLQWTFRPAGILFVIYNHNLTDYTDRWNLESNQLLVKIQYSFRY